MWPESPRIAAKYGLPSDVLALIASGLRNQGGAGPLAEADAGGPDGAVLQGAALWTFQLWTALATKWPESPRIVVHHPSLNLTNGPNRLGLFCTIPFPSSKLARITSDFCLLLNVSSFSSMCRPPPQHVVPLLNVSSSSSICRSPPKYVVVLLLDASVASFSAAIPIAVCCSTREARTTTSLTQHQNWPESPRISACTLLISNTR